MSLGIVLISLVILLSTSLAQTSNTKPNQTTILVNTDKPVVCFTEEDTKKIVVELENSADYQEQVSLLKDANSELEKQIVSLKEINKLQQEQLEISKRTIESYKELIKTQREAYETEIKNTKPSIWKQIITGISGLGIGVLIGLIL